MIYFPEAGKIALNIISQQGLQEEVAVDAVEADEEKTDEVNVRTSYLYTQFIIACFWI